MPEGIGIRSPERLKLLNVLKHAGVSWRKIYIEV